MSKEEFEKISDYLDKKLILCNEVKEPINKDLDCAIRLSIAYEDLYQRVNKVIELLNEYAPCEQLDIKALSILKGESKE